VILRGDNMAKIYEFKKTGYDSKEPCKNVYTIVYENKSYYYCKVNGCDELQAFRKESENKRNYNGEFWSTDDFDVNEAFQIMKDKKKKDDLHYIDTKISYAKRELEQLLKEKELLESLKTK
jgi:hypothetical protein